MIRLIPNNVDNNPENANSTDHQSIESVDVHDFEQWMLEEIEELT